MKLLNSSFDKDYETAGLFNLALI
jgi:hypothetical protein